MDERLITRMLNPWLMRLFYLQHLPGALFFGLKIVAIDQQKSIVQIPYRWSTQNPFQSIYFAALSAAAELSTGCIAMVATKGKSMSMLVTKMNGSFLKKAKGTIYFECIDVQNIIDKVKEAEDLPVGSVVSVTTIGRNKEGVEVARYTFEWSFRKKSA